MVRTFARARWCRVQVGPCDTPVSFASSCSSNAQLPRRRALAQARNYLLSRALDDEDYVLWIDVDVQSYPRDLLQVLLATNK